MDCIQLNHKKGQRLNIVNTVMKFHLSQIVESLFSGLAIILNTHKMSCVMWSEADRCPSICILIITISHIITT